MKKLSKKRRTIGRGIEELWQREVGETSPRAFAHRVGASQDLVLRLDIHKKLDKHRGCVNTVCFNEGGDILISGSDDKMVMLWNWDAGCVKLSFHSGHTNNVFQAKMMPYSDDRSIVTCAADGQVTQIPNMQIHTRKGFRFLKNEDKGIDQERLPLSVE